jgi:hypothetical protein
VRRSRSRESHEFGGVVVFCGGERKEEAAMASNFCRECQIANEEESMKLKRWEVSRTEGEEGELTAITFYGPWREGVNAAFTIYSDKTAGTPEFVEWLLRKLNAKPKRRA